MATAYLVFQDTEDGTDVNMGMVMDEETQRRINDGEEGEMTKATFFACLASYIFEQGHHEDFRDEFLQETARMMDDMIINNNDNVVDMRDESQKPKGPQKT